MIELYSATTNAGKLREFGAEPLPGLVSIEPCQETGQTFEDNAIQKAIYYSGFTTGYVFADDSGLAVDALGGAPGFLSARYAGLRATDEANNHLVLQRMAGISDRRARFVSVIALARGGQLVKTFRGEVQGELLHAPQGTEGFGYDPLFYYPAFGCSFGEVPLAQKQTVSHRARALAAMREYLLQVLQREIVECRQCTRLVAHCTQIAQVKRRAFRDWDYWGKPVPSFGDPNARLAIIGLAPGAHGANRTGRVFTGDSSGDYLYRALHAAGFANQPGSRSLDDGLVLTGAYIAASVRCAPPGNKPSPDEVARCRPYLERELQLLRNLKVVVALGKIAFDNYLNILKDRGIIRARAPFVFGHNVDHAMGDRQPILIGSYHPSQQNTSTGKLTDRMLLDVFEKASTLCEEEGWDGKAEHPRQAPSLDTSQTRG